MNIFQLIKKVLDDAYELVDANPARRDTRIRGEIATLMKKYADLRVYAGIDYGEPATRFAYVFKYVTSHANLVYTRIRLSRVLDDLFAGRDEVHLAALGGGPGSDMLGVVKCLQTQGWTGRLTAEVFDREPAWGETWAGVFGRVSTGVRVAPSFQTFDVTEPKVWSRFNRYLNADLFTMIYFMSEVYGIRDKAEPYFDHLFGRGKAGALLLYVDNNRSEFTRWFDGFLAKYGWEVLEHGEEVMKTPFAEEKRDLGEYYEKFGDPKLDSNVAWRIARKK